MKTGDEIGVKYLVVNENTLCYDHGRTLAGYPYVGVLAGSIIKGGHHWADGPIMIMPTDKVRPATLEDFEMFKVSPKGHLE